MKKIIVILLLIVPFNSRCEVIDRDSAAVSAFIGRIVKERAISFDFEFIDKDKGKDVFELESKNGRIILRGNNGISIGAALNHYLRFFCHSLITWNGVNLHLPEVLPSVNKKIRKISPYQYRYYLNYCTFNYSMAWWDWERWQREIDWMTLNGINMPLALTGEEAIWDKLYRKMGFTQTQLDSFFCGPSYFAWFWMGNLDAWGGPLSANWMRDREKLQKKILKAERAMGMTPVLPAFTGHVPPSFSTRFPSAKVKKTNWNSGFDDVLILDPADPLFEKIGHDFITEQTKSYGTDHLYSADTFNENIPPTGDSLYLNDISKKIFASMSSADPKATWIMQGWMFHYDSAFWKPTQTQALLNAVPDDRMLILDLYSESFPLWKKTSAYYGKPWIWNMLHNFGGNISLWGRINNPAHDPAAALQDPASGKMKGIGLTPEAIEQNPMLYQLMLDNTWSDEPIDIDNWLKEYIVQRYGAYTTGIGEAWHILANSVYQGGLTEGGPESIITARPTLEPSNKWARTQLDYDPRQLIKAWKLFVEASPSFKNNDGFNYDLTDITRQVLANHASDLQQELSKAFSAGDWRKFGQYKDQFMTLMDDMDALLATRSDFLLGRWLQQARKNGSTDAEKDLYERNARNLITTWGDANSPLHDYSCRQWAGLIKGFYKPRWTTFFNQLETHMKKRTQPDLKKIDSIIKQQEWQWVLQQEKYSDEPAGSTFDAVQTIFKKYKIGN